MAYFSPYVDATGYNFPAYQDIEDYLVQSAQSIYGQDIYLENDSQDFQFIAAQALTIYNTFMSAQAAYDAHSPNTSVGVGLDAVNSLNGLTRLGESNSIVTLTITGTPYTEINNGVVSDINGFLWDLPSTVIIGSGGSVSVTATCETAGAITLVSGGITTTNIQTPTFGWSGVTNPYAATPGQSVETDFAFKTRQVLSVSNPSQALTTGILGGVLALNDVITAVLYENDTGSSVTTINGAYNAAGYPAHSITVVVDGGAGQDVANAIALRKTPGCYTNGDQVYTYQDQYSVATTIRFFLSSGVPVDVAITIHALTAYTSSIGLQIEAAVVSYLNSLTIGQRIVYSQIQKAILSVNTLQYPYFSLTSVTINKHGTGNTPGTADIALNFNQMAQGNINYVSLTVS